MEHLIELWHILQNTHRVPDGSPYSWAQGMLQQNVRIAKVALAVGARSRGDIAYVTRGNTAPIPALSMAAMARGKRLQVLVYRRYNQSKERYDIDWDPDLPACKNLIAAVKPVKQHVDLIWQAEYPRGRICFVLIEPSPDYSRTREDLLSVAQCTGPIVVDYMGAQEQITRAVVQEFQTLRRIVFLHPMYREGYLLPYAG